jgi:hypothetical protein
VIARALEIACYVVLLGLLAKFAFLEVFPEFSVVLVFILATAITLGAAVFWRGRSALALLAFLGLTLAVALLGPDSLRGKVGVALFGLALGTLAAYLRVRWMTKVGRGIERAESTQHRVRAVQLTALHGAGTVVGVTVLLRLNVSPLLLAILVAIAAIFPLVPGVVGRRDGQR